MGMFTLLVSILGTMLSFQFAYAVEILAYMSNDDKTLETKWAPTEFNLLYLDNTISEANCGGMSIRFKGCVAAVDKFVYLSNANAELLFKNNQFYIGSGRMRGKSFKELQDYKRKKYDTIEAHFSQETLKALIVIFGQAKALNPNPKAYQVAVPINEYMAVVYDPHNMYQPTNRYNGLNLISKNPTIGTENIRVHNQVVINRVLKETPAEFAGLKEGDIITHADGQEIRLKADERIDDVLVYNYGQEVELTFNRKGHIFKHKLVFNYYSERKIVDRVLKVGDKKYAYLYMNEIPEDSHATCLNLSKMLQDYDKTTDGLVLDLRYNAGGPGETVACLSGLFMGEGKVAFVRTDISGTVRDDILTDFPEAYSKKMVVLVSPTTLSSGELVTAALQFYSRALVLGDRTFGKSIGQTVEKFGRERFEYVATIYYAYRPNGLSYHSEGIIPDYYVYSSGAKPNKQEREALREEDYALYPIRLRPIEPAAVKSEALQFPDRCVSHTEVQKAHDQLSEQDWKKDYQLQFALKTLDCMK